MTIKSFFSEESTQLAITYALTGIEQMKPASEFEKNRNTIVMNILKSMKVRKEDWDTNCQYTVASYARDFLQELQKENFSLNELCVEVFVFLYEYNLYSDTFTVRDGSNSFGNYFDIERFMHDNINALPSQEHLKWVFRGGILTDSFKRFINSDEVMQVRQLSESKAKLKTVIAEANNKIERVESLEATLKKQEKAFTFVLLYQGFDELSKNKNRSKYITLFFLFLLGVITTIPLSLEFYYLYSSYEKIESVDAKILALLTVPVVGLTAIGVYFFRVILSNYNSIKAQLLQIELRKTLCRFIQSYAEHSKTIKKNDEVAFKKFEDIIFTNIVGNDEKIPATFDGIEQFAKLIKQIKDD